MSELLQDFPVVIEFPIAWGDMDAFQHVNNVMYFRYFESARIAYFEKMKVADTMKRTGVGPILASTNCKFKFPLLYPDTVSVGARVPKIKTDRFQMEYRVVSHTHQKIAAEGEGLVVYYDYRQKKKTDIPLEIKKLVEDLEKKL
jgi:acyl-CoA thioester hydrolase